MAVLAGSGCHLHVVDCNGLAFGMDGMFVGRLEALNHERLSCLLQSLHGLLLVHHAGCKLGGDLANNLVERSLLQQKTSLVLELFNTA